jgi:hypothetical protein
MVTTLTKKELTLELLKLANSYIEEPYEYELICINKITFWPHSDNFVNTTSHAILGTAENVFAPILKDIEVKNENKILSFCEDLAEKIIKLESPILERRIVL